MHLTSDIYKLQLVIIFTYLMESNQSSGQQSEFKTHQESFNKSYVKTNHLQNKYNNEYIPQFVDEIGKYYQRVSKPLSILDLCCGHGGPTIKLYNQLHQKGIEVEKIVGYDVSQPMLQIAREVSNSYSKIQFFKKNIDKELEDVKQFDVVVSFFGLHWANNIEHVGKKIYQALKDGGLFFALTPLEVTIFLKERETFIKESKWSKYFEEEWRKLKGFHDSGEPYLKAYKPYFNILKEAQLSIENPYRRKDLITFLQSWIPEVRHIIKSEADEAKRDELAKAYLSELLDSIPDNIEGQIVKKGEDEIIWYQRLFVFIGSKKSSP